MSLLQIHQSYSAGISVANGIIASAHATNSSGAFLWKADERILIVEAAYLRIFMEWEKFIENSFHSYLLGELSAAGNSVARFVSPTDIVHAQKIAIGTRKYVDWGTPDTVLQLSGLYFDQSNPFQITINSVQGEIRDMKTIRNSAAHLSSTTSQQLDILATRKLHRPVTNISVSDFILATDPNSTSGETILQTYINVLNAATHNITFV